MNNLHGWGVVYNPHDVKKAGDFRCPECDLRYPIGLRLYELIVGFACDEPWQLKYNSDFGRALGVMILRCSDPECLAKGWIHLYKQGLHQAEEFCPNWPKD